MFTMYSENISIIDNYNSAFVIHIYTNVNPTMVEFINHGNCTMSNVSQVTAAAMWLLPNLDKIQHHDTSHETS